MAKPIPFLWFDQHAEEAMRFYLSVFKDSSVIHQSRYGEHGPGPAGTLMVGSFTLNGQEVMVLNGGPIYKLSPAFSFVIQTDSQEETDYYWDALAADGEIMACGWLTDRFGVSWQVVPNLLGKLMADPDKQKAGRVMQAMLKMKKIDSALLQQAYDNPTPE